MVEKKGLGRGLGSLIPLGNKSNDSVSKVYKEISVDDVVPNQEQPRKLFDKAAIDELAASIEEKGILQPLIVRELGGGKYELIAGERRYRAAKLLHLEQVPVIIKDVDANESLELALIENIQRQDLNPVEEALAYKELLEKYQYTQDELAKRIGKDRSSVANILRLLKLPESIRAHIISGQLSMGHARAMLGIDKKELQDKIADEIINHGLSVREIENWIRGYKGEKVTQQKSSTNPTKTPAVKVSQYRTLEEELTKILKTRVAIKSVGSSGKIVIHFHSPEELDGIYQMINRL